MLIPAPLGNVARHQFADTDDGRKHVVEVVGDATGQRSEGLHLLGLAELGLELLSLRLCLPALGDVGEDRTDGGSPTNLCGDALQLGIEKGPVLSLQHELAGLRSRCPRYLLCVEAE